MTLPGLVIPGAAACTLTHRSGLHIVTSSLQLPLSPINHHCTFHARTTRTSKTSRTTGLSHSTALLVVQNDFSATATPPLSVRRRFHLYCTSCSALPHCVSFRLLLNSQLSPLLALHLRSAHCIYHLTSQTQPLPSASFHELGHTLAYITQTPGPRWLATA